MTYRSLLQQCVYSDDPIKSISSLATIWDLFFTEYPISRERDNEQHLQSGLVSIKHELAQCMDAAPWLLLLLAAAAHAAGSVDHMGQHCENFFSQYDYLFRFNMEAQKHIGSIAMQSVENFGIDESEFKELVEEGKLSAFDNPWPPSRKFD